LAAKGRLPRVIRRGLGGFPPPPPPRKYYWVAAGIPIFKEKTNKNWMFLANEKFIRHLINREIVVECASEEEDDFISI